MPLLALNVVNANAATRYAQYDSGSGTDTITFVYVLQGGDVIAQLGDEIVNGGFGFELHTAITTVWGSNQGYIMRKAKSLIQEVNYTMPIPATAGSFFYKYAIAVDCTDVSSYSAVLSVTGVTTDGTYGAGQNIEFLVKFSQPVTVSTANIPYITVNVGQAVGVPKQAHYNRVDTVNSGLIFRYVVAPGDVSADLDYLCTCSDFYKTTYIEPNGA